MGEDFIAYSPFLFVFMAIYIALELWRINFYLNRWEINSLMIIPIMIAVLYLWIGIFNPSIELARYALRYVVATSLGLSMHVVYCVSRLLRKGGKHL